MDLIIRQAKIKDVLVDIGVEHGRIITIVPSLKASALQEIDAHGNLLSPPFVDPHLHLDAVLTAGEPDWNHSGTLLEGIALWNRRKSALSYDDVKMRAKKAVLWEVVQGVQHIRTHVDVCDPNLTALHALVDLWEEIKEIADIQIVAFPQEGIPSYPNGRELMTEAIEQGCDVVGGIPHYEITREYGLESLDFAFALARKYDKLIDIHCDETDDEQSRFIEHMAALTLEKDFQGRVTASHTTAMHSYNNAYAFKLIGWLKKAELNLITNPLDNIVLQGRFDTYPKRRGLTRVKELNEAGLTVAIGHDSIMDPWYQLGKGSMLMAASMLLHVTQMTGRQQMLDVFKMITSSSAKVMNIPNYEISEGHPANFIILNASDPIEALRLEAECLYSIRFGKVIATSRPVEQHVVLGGKTETIRLVK